MLWFLGGLLRNLHPFRGPAGKMDWMGWQKVGNRKGKDCQSRVKLFLSMGSILVRAGHSISISTCIPIAVSFCSFYVNMAVIFLEMWITAVVNQKYQRDIWRLLGNLPYMDGFVVAPLPIKITVYHCWSERCEKHEVITCIIFHQLPHPRLQIFLYDYICCKLQAHFS